MALPVFNPPVGPSFPAGEEVKPRVNWGQFGDGYKQGAPDGINHLDMTMDLSWENVTQAEKNAITAFFEARQGCQPFTYTLDGNTRTWVATEWSSVKNTPNSYVLTATFERNFSS